MSSKTFSMAAIGSLLIASLSGCAAVDAHHRALVNHFNHTSVAQNADPISGEWNVTFHVHESKAPASFSFRLDGANVTGTAYSEHTGPGTIRDGKWVDGKLSFTLDFQKHESIAISGVLKDGNLAGEFSTEGFTDKWEATKK